ncbi:hypothetical protein HYV64_00325 [Candidatus Shapirobacteria bacterium]|nr:hypothetical protein [Candidatus Shapirobacteria bacterium]
MILGFFIGNKLQLQKEKSWFESIKPVPFAGVQQYATYYYQVDDDLPKFKVQASTFIEDPYSELCNDCVNQEIKIGKNEITLMTNPNRKNPISIYIVPEENYGSIYSFQYYQLDQKGNEIEFEDGVKEEIIREIENW